MAKRATAITICYEAINESTGAQVTGDSLNHTLQWIKDGAMSATTNSPAEVSAGSAPGIYSIALTAAETTCDVGVLCGVSSTGSVRIIPTKVNFDESVAIKAKTDSLSFSGSDVIATLASESVTMSTAATGSISSGSISAAAANKIADHIIRRSMATCRASGDGDAVAARSLLGLLSRIQNRWAVDTGDTQVDVYEEDDLTVFYSVNYTTSALSDPITSMDPP